MAVILLGYFGTMVTAFAALMFFLASILDNTSMHHARPHPYKLSATARAMVVEQLAANAAKQPEAAQLQVAISIPAAVHPSGTMAANDGGKPMTAKQRQKAKLARDQRRVERLASRHLDREYSSLALGYAPESQTRAAAERIFSTIRSRR